MTNQNLLTEISEKTCRFHNKGHCNQKESCPFFHGNTICEIFRETGACWKQVCRERHPKICWYGDKCFRQESCSFQHNNLIQSCDRCEQLSTKRYHCEFCAKSFCEKCTVEKAHESNIYSTSENPRCENIHQ